MRRIISKCVLALVFVGCGSSSNSGPDAPKGPTASNDGEAASAASGDSTSPGEPPGSGTVVDDGGSAADEMSPSEMPSSTPDSSRPATIAVQPEAGTEARPDSGTVAPKDGGTAPVEVDAGAGWNALPAIVAQIVAPTFPNVDCDVTQYGGVGDGTTDNTSAFAKAITDCSSKGGGRVVVASGTFLTGPITLVSNINLSVAAGATIRFSTDATKYLPVVKAAHEGSLLYNYRPLLSAVDATNVAVTGSGTIDGNSSMADWWGWAAKESADSLNLRTQNANGVSPESRIYGSGHYLRPSLIEFTNCTNVLFDSFTAQNSPFWTIHPVMSKNITAHNVHSIAPPTVGNTDGFDPESCENVLIDGLTIQVGDDPIAIKAGRDRDGRTYFTPTKNVVIQNCTFLTHGGGVSVGSEMSAGVEGVYVQNSTFSSSAGGLGQAIYLKASVYRGGFIDDFYARKLTVNNVGIFFFLNGQYSSGTVPTAAVDYTMFNNLNVDTVTVTQTTSEPFRIAGADATVLATGIHISNVTITNAVTPVLRAGAAHYSGLTTSNVIVNGSAWNPSSSVP